MAKISMTQQLAEYLKELRLQAKIPAKTMAEFLNKSPAYVTKLEKCEFQSVDFDTIAIYLEKSHNGDEDKITESWEYISKSLNISISASEDEINREEAYRNFDGVYRQIPVSKDLQDTIKKYLTEINYSIEDLVKLINQNNDVPELKEREDIEYNKWYYSPNGSYSILIKLDDKQVNRILYDNNTLSNYITIQSILYTINRVKGLSIVKAMREAEKTMSSCKFYSIHERHQSLSQPEMATEEDKHNMSCINKIRYKLFVISDHNVSMANKQLDRIIANFDFDLGFTLAFMATDLSKLDNLSRDDKMNLLSDIKQLIEDYSHKENKQSIDFYTDD